MGELNGDRKTLLDRSRDLDRGKIIEGIKIVLSRFINNTDQAALHRDRIGKNPINFSDLKRGGVFVVLEANDIMLFMSLFHFMRKYA